MKVEVNEPLFRLRGLQVVERSSFVTNVAKEAWCGFPKYQQSNEWFILSLMIPGATCVHVVSLFTASEIALEALRSEETEASTQGDSSETTSGKADSDKLTSEKADGSGLKSDSTDEVVASTAGMTLNTTSTASSSRDSADGNSRSIFGFWRSSTPKVNPWADHDNSVANNRAAWAGLLRRMFSGDAAFVNGRFKMIPSVVQANLIIRNTVPEVPALTGNKVRQHYFRGPGYFEIDVSIDSNATARNILGMVSALPSSSLPFPIPLHVVPSDSFPLFVPYC